MSKKSAIEKTSDEEKEDAALAELSGFFDDVTINGMEEVGNDDLKIPSKIWNMKGLDEQGKKIPQDTFYDTITEEIQDTVKCVLLLTQKSNRYDYFDNDKDETVLVCSSSDMKTGTMREDGGVRPCEDCPDSGWFKDENGKPKRKCGPVHTVVAIEKHNQRPFIVRFKKTGLKPFRNHLQKHHWGARVDAEGNRKHIPMFAYECVLSLENHESGKYALPVLNCGNILSREAIMKMAQSAKDYREMMQELMKHADATDERHNNSGEASGGKGNNFTSDDFVE